MSFEAQENNNTKEKWNCFFLVKKKVFHVINYLKYKPNVDRIVL
jgi:hypothetical protein